MSEDRFAASSIEELLVAIAEGVDVEPGRHPGEKADSGEPALGRLEIGGMSELHVQRIAFEHVDGRARPFHELPVVGDEHAGAGAAVGRAFHLHHRGQGAGAAGGAVVIVGGKEALEFGHNGKMGRRARS